MSTANFQMDQDTWSTEADWVANHSRLQSLLPVLGGAAFLMIDVAVVLVGFLVAHWVRFVASGVEVSALGLDKYIGMGLSVGVITSLFLGAQGLYDEERRPAWPKRLNAIVSAVSTALILAIVIWFFLGDQAFSRLWFGTAWAFSIGGLIVWRTLAERIYAYLSAAIAPLKRILIVGANPLGLQLASELSEHYEVVGYVDNGSDLAQDSPKYPLLGPIAQLDHVVNSYGVDELIIALPASRREQVERLIARGFQRRLKIKFLPGLDDLLPRRFEVHDLGGRRYIGFASAAAVRWPKRVLDLVITAAGVLAISPLLLIIAAAIKVDSTGPVFYRQERLGKDGRSFRIYKFRSMVVDADHRLAALRSRNEAIGPLFKIRQDPRITRVGAFLRRWSLDELPQLLNVLRGEMSLVGPRPPLPSEVAEYEDWQLGRLRAVPGLTGLWQVSGRSEVPFHDMVRLDLHYIRNWSLSLDLEIMLRTIPAVLSNRGAY